MTNRDEETRKGRMISILVHIGLVGLLAFPFLSTTFATPERETVLVMDFSSGSSHQGATATPTPKPKERPKAQPKPVVTQKTPEVIEVPKDPIPQQPTIPEKTEAEDTPEPTSEEAGSGTAAKGGGDAESGQSANGNGRGFIEGTGVLTRAVIDRGSQRKFARQDGTVVLKICINRRGNVVHAEWDKDQSSIKDTDIARDAIDNVLNYKFERDNNAPKKECGRMTYIIDVE